MQQIGLGLYIVQKDFLLNVYAAEVMNHALKKTYRFFVRH